jgi:hypothetical protein
MVVNAQQDGVDKFFQGFEFVSDGREVPHDMGRMRHRNILMSIENEAEQVRSRAFSANDKNR